MHELICSVMFSVLLSLSLYIYIYIYTYTYIYIYMHVYNLSLLFNILPHRGFSGDASVKNPSCQCRRSKRHCFNLWFRKMPWKRAWQSTPVFLPGKSPRIEEPAGYSPQGHKSWTRLKCQHTCMHSVILCTRFCALFLK